MSIEQYVPRNEIALSNAQDLAIHRLGEWAQSAQAAHQIAQTLVQTSFCPESFRNKAGEATAAILAGLEVGLQPMAALRSFDVIQGQAAPRAITLRAIVQSHGHDIEIVESTASRCKMKGRRKGSSDWQNVTWTIERAQQLGVTNKPNWKNQPQSMLVARATSEVARLIASDAILGIAYSAEEIGDGGTYDQQVAGEIAAPAPAANVRKMSRRPKKADEDGQPLRDEEGQRRAMFAAFTTAGYDNDDRQGRLDYCMTAINREIESSSDMTWDEVSTVIDALNAEVPVAPDEDAPLPDPHDGNDPWATGDQP